MRFMLLSLNIIIMVALGVYLLNIFSVNELGINGIGLIVISSLAITMFANYLIEERYVSNPLFFILPGLAASVISVLATKGLSIITIIAILFIVPGLVMLIRDKSKSKE
ncbi:MAG: hypothetical protein QW054_05435 [Candidatus Micrarchaeia archaeon]